MDTPTPAKRARPHKTSAPKRAPGRPAAADNPDLRARLLDAAIACYARQGIAATSLRAIAAEAGVNPALLHYYFGDKEQLQEAVSNERLIPVFVSLRDGLTGEGKDVFDLIGGFVAGVGRIVAAHPWLPSLWVREVLCEGGALRESVLFQKIGPVLPQMMAKRFAQAQAEGRINPDLDPRLLMVSLIGLTLFPAASAPIWRFMFDAEDLDLDTQRRHALALLDRGLMP
jgi:AcrR family transcriptional regulator